MENFGSIFEDNLTDIAQYNPHLRLYLDNPIREFVEGQLGDIRMMLYEWESNMITHRAVDIITLAVLEAQDWIVYRIMERLGFANPNLNYYVVMRAGTFGRVEIIEFMIENGYDDWEEIAVALALCGEEDTLFDVIAMGADNFDEIAASAAKGGHFNIVLDMIDIGVTSYDDIADAAAMNGHFDIIMEMIKYGARNYNKIAERAADHGYKDIVYEMLKKDSRVSTLNRVARRAAGKCYEDIVYEMLSDFEDNNGNIVSVTDYNGIADAAAMGGCTDLVIDMLNRGATHYGKIAKGAARHGNREILNLIIDKLERGDYLTMAVFSAIGGHKEIMEKAITLYEQAGGRLTKLTWKMIAQNAAFGGRKEIVMDMYNKGVNVKNLDYHFHEDARQYFS